ncbi:multidrug efflux MFS transporter [Clostridium sp. AWRP]|nr:multidrug efflux MFS transporter [Clostridium sp. AWRP]
MPYEVVKDSFSNFHKLLEIIELHYDEKVQKYFISNNEGVSLDQIQWVISAYTLTLGVTIPSTGYLSDRFGFKKVFVIAHGHKII